MPFGFTPAPAKATEYQPSLRDRAAIKMIDVLGGSHLAQDIVGSLMGSRGMGTYKPGVVDFIPLVGQAFQGDDGGRMIAQGQPVSGAANVALAAIPIPAAGKAARAGSKLAKSAISDAMRGIRGEDGGLMTLYHGSPNANLEGLEASARESPWGFTPVVSLSTDPKFARSYAGDAGRVYEATVHTNNVGDFRDPQHLSEALDFLRQKYGELDPYDREALAHGAWRLWEDPDLWKSRGWDGAWVREEPGRPDANALNLSLATGEHVRIAPDRKATRAGKFGFGK